MSEAPKFAPGSLYAGISFSQSGDSSGSTSTDATANQNSDSANAPKKNWSTALAFAPIRRAPAQKPKPPRPSAALFFTPTPNASSGSKSTDIVREAAPVIHKPKVDLAPSNANSTEQTFTRALPSLTLDDDVNGFNKRSNASYSQDPSQTQTNKKKKKKKNRGHPQEQARAMFNPMEPYDPAKPNDFEEYTRWRAEEKRRKERIRREKKEYAKKVESESESSYYTEDEEEEEQERARAGRYIGQPPPASYNTSTTSSNPFPVFQPATSQPVPSHSGLNPSAPSFTPANIVASSTPPPPPPPPPPPSSFAAPPQTNLSGEEAYLRRAALSSAQQPTGPVDVPRDTPSIPSMSSSIGTGAAPIGVDSEEFQRKVEERKKAAAAIAARFAKPAGLGASVGSIEGNLSTPAPLKVERDPNDNRDFATRMMDKWGHETGKGLGVDASGITNPLQIAQTHKSKPKPSSSAGPSAPFQPRAMGKVISETTARKNAEDVARFGESSRIVLLMHMVGSVDEVDDELSQDIAEECGKFGVVERVIIHEAHPTPSLPEDRIRVFVVFSGPAGAWTAIRALDERFFGGRPIKARYFPEDRFDRGDRDN